MSGLLSKSLVVMEGPGLCYCHRLFVVLLSIELTCLNIILTAVFKNVFRITKGYSAALQFAYVAPFKQGVGNIICLLCAREGIQQIFSSFIF